MGILDYAIIFFIVMELTNVIVLYFKPQFPYANGIAVFDSYEDAKKDEPMYLFVKYLKNWVANVKLIFIVLLMVIVAFGDETLKVAAVIVLILSIFVYYISLHPLIRKLDKMDKISPKGYSNILFAMITGFIVIFGIALILHFVL
ncbi:MAG: hypothetical protein R3Y60_03725 [bacterium]